jgi:hypothetical protein
MRIGIRESGSFIEARSAFTFLRRGEFLASSLLPGASGHFLAIRQLPYAHATEAAFPSRPCKSLQWHEDQQAERRLKPRPTCPNPSVTTCYPSSGSASPFANTLLQLRIIECTPCINLPQPFYAWASWTIRIQGANPVLVHVVNVPETSICSFVLSWHMHIQGK